MHPYYEYSVIFILALKKINFVVAFLLRQSRKWYILRSKNNTRENELNGLVTKGTL